MASIQNLASGVLTASVTSSATSLGVSCGDGSSTTLTAVWPNTPFFITVMPSRPVAGVANSLDSEVMKVTALSVANNVITMTVTRAQRNTSAKAFSEGAIVTNGIYIDDILDRIYPVGSIYMSATLSTTTQVANALGGTWVAFGAGRVLVGVDATQTEFNTVLKTGGEKTHTLTETEMPSHSHSYCGLPAESADAWADPYNRISYKNTSNNPYPGTSGAINASGGGQAHNNLQPYITCYMYRRIA